MNKILSDIPKLNFEALPNENMLVRQNFFVENHEKGKIDTWKTYSLPMPKW